jgi:hypothetical protein
MAMSTIYEAPKHTNSAISCHFISARFKHWSFRFRKVRDSWSAEQMLDFEEEIYLTKLPKTVWK